MNSSLFISIKLFIVFTLINNCVKLSDGASNSIYANRRLDLVQEITSKQFTIDSINYHNAIRAYHGLSPLIFDVKLQNIAKLQAFMSAFRPIFAPDIGSKLNLGINRWFQRNENSTPASIPIKIWYKNGSNKWNYTNPQITEENQYFAQLVWKSSRFFGCGQATSEFIEKGTYTVCLYSPSILNDSKLIKDNVSPPLFDGDDADNFIDKMVHRMNQVNT